jgi:hypothetical protein
MEKCKRVDCPELSERETGCKIYMNPKASCRLFAVIPTVSITAERLEELEAHKRLSQDKLRLWKKEITELQEQVARLTQTEGNHLNCHMRKECGAYGRNKVIVCRKKHQQGCFEAMKEE